MYIVTVFLFFGGIAALFVAAPLLLEHLYPRPPAKPRTRTFLHEVLRNVAGLYCILFFYALADIGIEGGKVVHTDEFVNTIIILAIILPFIAVANARAECVRRIKKQHAGSNSRR